MWGKYHAFLNLHFMASERSASGPGRSTPVEETTFEF
jgi:hypothetical protein